MRLSKKKESEIRNAISDFFDKQIPEIIEQDFPPEFWTKEEKMKFDARATCSYSLSDHIISVIKGGAV